MRPSTAILYRDATRLSRRWQTHALRAGFSGMLLALVLGVIWFLTEFQQQVFDPGKLGDLGRYLFQGFAAVQVVLAAVVAPYAAASAVIEEREQGTVEILLLTRLSAQQLLFGKIAARLLVIASLILGALPVLAMVTSIGGVSVIEVLAVCVHALTTVMVLGAMGAFFGVFTRHAVLATVMAVSYGVTAFSLMPALTIALTAYLGAPSWFSPLLGTLARDANALVPALTYLPPTVLTLILGARFYELRISGSHQRHFFEGEMWSKRAFLVALGLLGFSTLTALPVASGLSWVLGLGGTPSAVAILPRVVVLLWCELLLVVCTWMYLRVAVDLVQQVDDMLEGRRKLTARTPFVWRNPVAWRELHGRLFSQVGPSLGAWGLVVMAVGLSALWLFPGGMLLVGAGTVGLGVAQAAWVLGNGLSAERENGSLDVLLTTTLSGPTFVVGKVLATLVPTGVFLVGGLPLVWLGAPHLQLLFVFEAGAASLLWAALNGLLACLWLVGLWLFVTMSVLVLALRLARPRNAAPMVLGAVSAGMLIPAMMSASLPPRSLVQIPLRLLSPVLVAHPRWWEISLSMGALYAVALALFVLACVKLRSWGSDGS